MNSFRVYISILFLLASLAGSAQVQSDIAEADSLIRSEGQAEVLIKFPGIDYLAEIGSHLSVSGFREGLVSIVLAPGDLNYFASLNLPFYLPEREETKAVICAATMADAMNWESYPTYQQYDSIMRKFAFDYPQICRLDTIGISYQGRLVLALKISDNAAEDEREPSVFYTSSMHGDELVGFVLMMRLAEHLLANYSTDWQSRMLVDSLQIWINPLANPDGTYRGYDIEGRDTIYNPVRTNYNGTDLNRSFPAPFVESDPDNETNNFINFQAGKRFILSANFHSGAEVVNYPWDTWYSVTHADDIWFETISRAYADTVHRYSLPGYFIDQDNGIIRGALWYVIDGGRQDYVTYAQQGREVTIELDEVKLTPGGSLPLFWEYHRRSLLGYLENAIYGIHGVVSDETTGEKIGARIFIPGHDRDSSHIYSDTISGFFARLLANGSYDLLFTAEGYLPEMVEGVVVSDREQTWLNVKMKRDEPPTDTRSVKIWPVPADKQISVQLPGDFTGESVISIISVSGQVILSSRRDIISLIPENIDISSLAGGRYVCRVVSLESGRKMSASFVKR